MLFSQIWQWEFHLTSLLEVLSGLFQRPPRSAAMLAVKRVAGIAGQMSLEVQNGSISSPHKKDWYPLILFRKLKRLPYLLMIKYSDVFNVHVVQKISVIKTINLCLFRRWSFTIVLWLKSKLLKQYPFIVSSKLQWTNSNTFRKLK